MNVKQGITVAAVLGATALGLAVPAFADDFDHRGHGPDVTAHQCRNGGGHVKEEGMPGLLNTTPVPPAGTVPAYGSYRHCSDGRYSGMQITRD